MPNAEHPPALESNPRGGRSEPIGADPGRVEDTEPDARDTRQAGYWARNLRLLSTLMAIWFVVSFGAGILLRDLLDRFSIGGYPLGFWFAQQGSIYAFIALIFFYTFRMKRIEREYGFED